MNIKEKCPLASSHLYAHHNTSKTNKQSIMKTYSMGVLLNFVKTFQFFLKMDNKNKHLTSGMQKSQVQGHLGD